MFFSCIISPAVRDCLKDYAGCVKTRTFVRLWSRALSDDNKTFTSPQMPQDCVKMSIMHTRVNKCTLLEIVYIRNLRRNETIKQRKTYVEHSQGF